MNDIKQDLKMFFVDYCPYGAKYRKRTVLWCNIDLSLNLCLGKGKCSGMENRRHIYSIGNGSKKYKHLNSAYEKS
jgi:hypothetical protein